MDLDASLQASDPSADLSPQVHEALLAMASDAEASIIIRPRRRRLTVVSGAVGAVLVGAGVSNAAGVPLPGLSEEHPHTACSVTVGPVVTSVGTARISIKRDQQGITLLAHLVRDRSKQLEPTRDAASRHDVKDMVERLAAQSSVASPAKTPRPGATCLQR